MYELSIDSYFDASHSIDSYDGEISRIHGHTWLVTVSVTAETLGELGYSVDFKVISTALKTILKRFDHVMLNELEELKGNNPTAENIARVLYNLLSEKLNSDDASVSAVTVCEGKNNCITYSC